MVAEQSNDTILFADPSLIRTEENDEKIAIFLLMALIPLACVTPPPGGMPEARPELDGLMEHWIGALLSKNIDALMEVYWPEAEKVILRRDGGEVVLRGIDRIMEQQSGIFERPELLEDLHYSEPEREFHGDGAAYHYHVERSGGFFVEHFEFIRREGRWAIMNHVIDLRAGEPREGMAEAAGTTAEEARFESAYYKKLGMIQDKKLAVVGIKSGTKDVDEETAGGVMVFIENAFVNVGKVRVVDRQNITKIVKEYEFQQSDLTDQTTAVEIGKLSGADIIVIGSISYAGKQYYLNIKLISVETGEIIGSSIDKAIDATGFYEMCNQAVYKLF